MDITARIADDLEDSGLVVADMGIRELDNPAKAALQVGYTQTGFVIPYFNIRGGPVPFYRGKLFDSDIKYKQPKDTPSHIYFPKGFLQVAQDKPYVIITEGEKKATRAVKGGFPAVGIGGVDSWRNRIFTMPSDSELNSSDKKLTAKLPSGSELEESFLSPLATGLQDLIDYVLSSGKHLILVYDQDEKESTSHKVQAAAATFGYELRFRGIPYSHVRQIRLPDVARVGKVGLDDYLQEVGEASFEALVTACLSKQSAFPRHPNVRDYLNKRLQKAKMSRKEMQQVAMAILSELDANGMRLRSIEEGSTYYFNRDTHKLLNVDFDLGANGLTDNAFGQYLYRTYGIGTADQRLIQWVGSQFTGEEPITDVSPFRVLARPEQNHQPARDCVILQIGDGQYAEVSANILPGSSTPGLTIHDNGENGILFESGHVNPLDAGKIKAEYSKQALAGSGIPLPCWWNDVLGNVRLVDKTKQRVLTALLFYVAPWLQRWRGTQLPLEMTLGEAGSGKSTLQELRMDIITGQPHLRNAPQDTRDWAASVANSGGLHIIDNLQLLDKNLRNKLSDEYCRIITEPNPTIEQRKLYSNNELVRIPVRVHFGITAIKQPFLNSDILARSIIIELDKSQDLVAGNLVYDASWKSTQIQRFGGREAWVAHHLLVLHRFFELVQRQWNHKYQAKYRLINLEQAMMTMAKVFGIDGSWIPEYLSGSVADATVRADWALEGIIAFARERPSRTDKEFFIAQDICNFAASDDEYCECEELTNSRRLGRYMQNHKSIIASQSGIIEAGTTNNRIRYTLVKNAAK